MSAVIQQNLPGKPDRFVLAETLWVVLLLIPVCVLGIAGEILAGAYFAAAAVALALAWRKPYFSLVGMVVVTFFINMVAIKIGRFNLHVADTFFFVVWLIFVTKVRQRHKFLSDPLVRVCLVLFGLGCLGAVVGVARGNDFALIPSELRPFAYYLLVIPFVHFLADSRWVKKVLLYLVVGAMIAIILGFARAVVQPELTGISYNLGPISFGRLVWPLLPTFLPMHFALIAFVLRSTKQFPGRAVLTWCVLLSTLALFLSLTRGALLGAVVGLLTIPVFFKGRILSRKQALAWSVILLAVMVGADFASGHAFSERLMGAPEEDLNLLQRVYETKQVVAKIGEHPVIGNGLGALHTPELPLEQPKDARYWVNPSYSHNAYLYLWFKLGILGPLSLFFLIGLLLRKSLRAYRQSEHSLDRLLAPLVFCSIAATMIVSITSPLFVDENDVPLIAALIAIAVTLQVPRPELSPSVAPAMTARTGWK